ncbi:germinal-center associated nuclear protein isoform X2 [Neocloeon triangulifer]|nr:germinal-center associated nuclear protein isoform X2 [Neocloeon triangulifer]
MNRKFGMNKAYVPPHARQMTSPERLKKIRSLVCLNVPPQLLDKASFKRHFSQFGTVTKINITAAKNSAQVHFETHEQASAAKRNAAKGFPESFQLFWSQVQPRKSLDLDTSGSPTKKATASGAAQDVQEELQSMSQQGGYVTSERRDEPGPSKQPRVENISSNPFAGKSEAPPNPFGRPSVFGQQSPSRNLFQPKENPPQLFQLSDKPKPLFGLPPASLNQPEFQKSIFGTTAKPDVQFQTNPPTEVRSSSVSKPAVLSVQAPKMNTKLPAETLTLLSTAKKVANSIEDKLAVLEARDKLIRQKRVKSSNLASATKTIGTCPDMCPEKERFLRIDRHQVSQYEIIDGELNHQFFVKQYSRSSADQELPLAHELRPSPVLRMTMNYLLSHIAPRVELPGEHLGEWFLFLWDRTRAIRKEVTQQELCNEDAVVLLEQCARFHIACAARLAAENVKNFEPKINTENLAKCLQTLKHLYHDMSLEGKACQNEAEFRAYIVLLNLNTGDAIWEVQQLSPDVLASIPVKQAIKVYLSLSTHNFVGFFKMVRTMGFLPAAILMRYFTQVRSKALEILIRSFCHSVKSSFAFPLDNLVRLLAFEDISEAAEFCQHHGLDTTTDMVLFSRTTFMKPETSIPIRRAKNLVESQLQVTFAEAIAGYPIASFNKEPNMPASSFGPRGTLNPEILASLEEISVAQMPSSSNITLSKGIFSSQSLFPQTTQMIFGQTTPSNVPARTIPTTPQSLFGLKPAAREVASHMDPQKVARIAEATWESIVTRGVSLLVQDTASKMLRDAKRQKIAHSITKTHFIQTIDQYTKEICTSELAVVKKEENLRKLKVFELKQREKMREKEIGKKSDQLVHQFVYQVVAEEARSLASAELQRQKILHNWVTNTNARVTDEALKEIVCKVASEELREAQLLWRKQVQELTEKLLLCRARRMLLKWRDLMVMLKERRAKMQRFPAGRSVLNTADQLAELSVVSPKRHPLFWTRKEIQNLTSFQTTGTQSLPLVDTNSISSMLKVVNKPVPLLVGDYQVTPTVWRLLVSIPSADFDLRTWAELCFARGRLSDQGGSTTFLYDDLIMTFELSIGLTSTKCTPNAVALVVKDQSDAADRLEQLLLEPPPVPVALLMLGDQPLGKKLECALQRLSSAKVLFNVNVFVLPEEPDSAAEIQGALEWLAQKSKNSVDFYVVTTVSDLVSSIMHESFWQTVVLATGPKTHQQNSALQKNPVMCHAITNAALDHLAKLTLAPALLQPEEECLLKNKYKSLPANWNSWQFRQNVSQAINKHKLPPLDFDIDNCDWPSVFVILTEFCRKLPMESSRLSLLISWTSHQIIALSKNYSASPDSLPWPSLIENICSEFIASQKLTDPLSRSGSEFTFAISNKQLLEVLSCNWCPNDLLRLIRQLCQKACTANLENSGEQIGLTNESSQNRRVLEDLHNKLQSFLLDLEESKKAQVELEMKINNLS